jgi:DNA-binding NtrC family response regulator
MAAILVLDDVADAGVLIQRILERKGHVVHPFTDEEEALAFAKANPVDLAILDIKLRKMNGIDVLEELRNVAPALKVMMLTGYPTLETAKRAQELGAVDYCVKPIDKEELETKVAQALAR